MNIENFIKVLQRYKIFLNTNEIQIRSNEFDFFEKRIVKYQILFEQIYYLLTGNGRKVASLFVLKNYFAQTLLNTFKKKFFLELINETIN